MIAEFDLSLLSGPTLLYLTLYLATLFIHFVFMAYVLGGSIYLVGVKTFATKDRVDPAAELIRDWMPFAISAAITAGVAPLLFIQILYKHRFYTANLLLFHRWMFIVPVLILAFYLAYVIKTKRFDNWSRPVRVVIASIMMVCFIFVAWSWTENHLLSLNDAAWHDFYVRGDLIYRSSVILPRLLGWMSITVAIMTCLISFQLPSRKSLDSPESRNLANRRLATIGLISLPIAIASFILTAMIDSRLSALASSGIMTVSVLVIGGVGLLISMAGWTWQRALSHENTLSNYLPAIGLAIGLVSILLVREMARISSVDITALASEHIDASEAGGLWVFLAFFLLNAVLIAICIRFANRAIKNPTVTADVNA